MYFWLVKADFQMTIFNILIQSQSYSTTVLIQFNHTIMNTTIFYSSISLMYLVSLVDFVKWLWFWFLLLSSAKSILGDSDFCFFCIFLLVLVRFNFLDIDFRTNFLDFERTTLTTVGAWEIVFEASSLESESQTKYC